MTDLRALNAIITLADRELSRDDWQDRSGALRVLLEESMPYLRGVADRLRETHEALAILRRELALAESGSGERSDPASNADRDEEVAILKAKIAELEVAA